MNTKLVISICLVLVSMIGVGCVSAANNQTSIQTNVEEMNVEMANEENLIKTQSESVKQVEKSANIESSKRNALNSYGYKPWIKDLDPRNKSNEPIAWGVNIKNNKNNNTSNSNNQTIKSGANNTNNSNNKTHYGPKLDIKGPKGNNTNNSDNKNHFGPKLDIKGPKGNNLTPNGLKIDGPIKGLKLIKKSKTFNYKGEKVYIAIMDDGSKLRAYMYRAEGSGMGAGMHCAGMSSAGSSYAGEVASEIVDILHKEGVIDAAAYYTAWLQVKLTRKLMEWFDEDTSGFNEQFWINYWAFGTNTTKYRWN